MLQMQLTAKKYWRILFYPLSVITVIFFSHLIGAPVSYFLLFVMAFFSMIYFVFQEAIIHYYLKEYNEAIVASILLLVISAYITKI